MPTPAARTGPPHGPACRGRWDSLGCVRSLSFLFTRRWIVFLIVILLLALGAWRLGEWQFHRLDARKASNEIVERNTSADPVAVEDVLTPGLAVDPEDQWLPVTATGEYDVENTVVVRYRTREGKSGVDLVVPLVTETGTSLLVDRGWVATANSGARPDDVPDPPAGTVTVVGWVRKDASGDSTKVSDKSTRSISSSHIADALGITVYGGFVDLVSEDPPPEQAPALGETPELNNGPHFFYGLQWWFFGLLALLGFAWMAYDEWSGKSSQRTRKPAVNRKQHATDKA